MLQFQAPMRALGFSYQTLTGERGSANGTFSKSKSKEKDFKERCASLRLRYKTSKVVELFFTGR